MFAAARPAKAEPESENNVSSAPSNPAEPGLAAQWTPLVERIQGGDESAMEELYRLFSKGIRFYLYRQLGLQELDDKVHDTFLIVVQAIRRGELREPERLMGFVRTVVRRQVAGYIGDAIQGRRERVELEAGAAVPDSTTNPEETAITRQNAQIMKNVLQSVSERDREILTRFYLLEQPQEKICAEMNLTDTQFRLLKSRAKARFGELGKKQIVSNPISFFMRRKTASGH